MCFTTRFIVFIILAANGTSGKIIYVNESVTWDEARSNCTYTYNGRLASLTDVEENKDGVESCVPRNVDVWTGEYSQITPWIISMGCYKAVYKSYHTLDYPSVFLCFKKCPEDAFVIAIKEDICVCPYYNDVIVKYIQVEASVCNMRCDEMAFCGGKRGYNVYWKEHRVNATPVDQLCATITCADGHLEYQSAYCYEERPFICGDDKLTNTEAYHDHVNWTTAMDLCIERKNTSLVNLFACNIELHSNHQYWVGTFRSEIVLPDEGLDCYYTDNGVDYQGYVNTTKGDDSCTDWSLAPSYHNLEKNYCRNPSGDMSPWCFVCSDNCNSRLCNVTKCDTPVWVFKVRKNRNGTIESTAVRYSNISESPYLCKIGHDIQVESNVVDCRPGQGGDVGARSNSDVDSEVKQSAALPVGVAVTGGLIFTIAVSAVIILKRRSTKREHRQKIVTSDAQTKMDDKQKNTDQIIQTSSTGRNESDDSIYCEIKESSLLETFDGPIMIDESENENFIPEKANDIQLGKRRRYEMLQIPRDDRNEHIYTITDPCNRNEQRGITEGMLNEGVYTLATGKQYFVLEKASLQDIIGGRSQYWMEKLSAGISDAKMYTETSEGSKSELSKPDDKNVNIEYASKYGRDYFVLESTSKPGSSKVSRQCEARRKGADASESQTYIEIIGNGREKENTSIESRRLFAIGQIIDGASEDGGSSRRDGDHLPDGYNKNERSDGVDGDDNVDVYTQVKMDDYDQRHTTNRRHLLTSSTTKRLGDKEEEVSTTILEDN